MIQRSISKKKGHTAIALGAGLAAAAIAIISSAGASVSLAGGGFLIHAQDVDEPQFEATAGMQARSPGGGEGSETDKVVWSLSCMDETIEVTQKMVDWDTANRNAITSGGSAKPNPKGGWSYLIDTAPLVGAKGYIFSATPEFSTEALAYQGSGPAMAYGNSEDCAYNFYKDGKPHADGKAAVGIYSSASGAYNKVQEYYQNGVYSRSEGLPSREASYTSKADGPETLEQTWFFAGATENSYTTTEKTVTLQDGKKTKMIRFGQSGTRATDPLGRYRYESTTEPYEVEYFASGQIKSEQFLIPVGEEPSTYTNFSRQYYENGDLSREQYWIDESFGIYTNLRGPQDISYYEDGRVKSTIYRDRDTIFYDPASYAAAGGTGWIGRYFDGVRQPE